MAAKGMICIDMDGTIADLYQVPNWLSKIQNEDPSPYKDAQPMWNMLELREALLELVKAGWEIRVISWLAKDSSERYKQAVRFEKKAWLWRYNFPASKVHLVEYGTTKADCVRRAATAAILIDDNAKIRHGWHLGRTIDPTTCNLIEELRKLAIE